MFMKVRPYHILVTHKYEADDILIMLKNGKPFDYLAKKYSLCRNSSFNGGYLGEVDSINLDSDFFEAFESLGPNEVSIPIRTRFGWHLIKKG